MVDFKLSPEEEMISNKAKEFTKNYIIPRTREIDENDEVPIDILQKAYEEGFMNLHIPKDVGGPDLSLLVETLVGEATGYGCAGIATTVLCNNLAFTPLLIGATTEQLKKYITPLVTGDKVQFGSFSLTERVAGSDAANTQTSAVKDGDEYIINGTKCFITNAPLATLHTVFATTNPELKHKGISVFMVKSDLPGVTIGHIENKMGQRGSTQSEIIFDDVRIPEECLVGNEGEGFKIAMKTLDKTRAGIAAIGVGVAQRAADEAGRYANTRIQFGRPIGKYQGISFTISDMACKAAAARHLTRYAAWLADNDLPNTKDSAFAKYFASDAAMQNAIDAVQIFGGYGYMVEYPVEKLVRDAKLLQIYEGTNQVQRLVAGNAVLRETKELEIGYKLDYPGKNAPQI
ncbi:MAG: acyl-CoA dehydrogenase family protein [Candidatus Hodarchaeales archaeon]|jgi:acyl-CoA dehydrogenase